MNDELSRSLLIRMATGQPKPKRNAKRQASSIKLSESPKFRRNHVSPKSPQNYPSTSLAPASNNEPVFPLMLADSQEKSVSPSPQFTGPQYENVYYPTCSYNPPEAYQPSYDYSAYVPNLSKPFN
ncbi:hypothetical protein Ciccas_012284 [Cichlidogyrus casuarinus]|uniref:Uncharacterized protein n=1 Tax=Cichlidogyrus casuarinus TaxID=1844966 RepID=A0ABD2PNT1_9PLAT